MQCNAMLSSETIKLAIAHMKRTTDSIQKTATEFGIPRSTLRGYITKENVGHDVTVGYAMARRVFTEDQETELENYLRHACAIYFGLTPEDCRELAYACAQKYGITYPESWDVNKRAGYDWYHAFMRRHPGLSLRTPESTSLGRASAFNKANVSVFFEKLGSVLDRDKFSQVIAIVYW